MKNVFKKLGIILLIIGSLFLIYNGYIFYGLYFKGMDFIYDREKALDVGKNKFGIRDVDYDLIMQDPNLTSDKKKYLINIALQEQKIIKYSNKKENEKLYNEFIESIECLTFLMESDPYFEHKARMIMNSKNKSYEKERSLFYKEFWNNIGMRFRSSMSTEDSKDICPKYIKELDL